MNMASQAWKSFFLNIISNLITPIILFLISIILGIFLNISLESKLAIVNIALIVVAILIILKLHFSPKRVRVIRVHDHPHIYMIEKNIARHIPNMATFNYLGELYGFHEKDIETITDDEFKKFSRESILPDVIPHLPSTQQGA
jgi:hypothetical protein